ncbi:hypothetical protein JOD02_001405 [Caldicoprobacter guelmensis]|uniref:hypothetical protein n=1 Tax=Caldicoprobacter guelmensis TaxID=1170224 RepID=UPI00195E05A9|nr:hypothetical protein [Caldicoprobacter guelmensis]MBM7582548.1 hypothetical protein [Caldicoprobacter guelmensis]
MCDKTKSLMTIVIIMVAIISLIHNGYSFLGENFYRYADAFLQIPPINEPHYGYIQPHVVDGFTERPIEGAAVVIPELGKKFKTNAQGLTPAIRVPIIEDTHYKNILPKTWGEITLIVYKEGYIDYVLFHTHVWENQSRKGPKILLFPQSREEVSDPMAIIESPHRLWVKQLVEKFKH